MQIILSDHNCVGQARQIIYALHRLNLAEIVPVELRVFNDIGLSEKADDEIVWRICQKEGYLLLTGNRRTVDEEASLELTIRRLYTPTILPVLTIGDTNRVMYDRVYCERCAERLAEILLGLDDLRGITRLYLT